MKKTNERRQNMIEDIHEESKIYGQLSEMQNEYLREEKKKGNYTKIKAAKKVEVPAYLRNLE